MTRRTAATRESNGEPVEVSGLIDLHTHVLPGIDDGAASFAEAEAMCRAAAADGCTALVATPHLRHARFWNGERRELEALFDEARERLGGEIELHLGGEIAVHFESVDEIFELPRGELLTLAGSRYALLELDWHGIGPDVFDVVHELKVRGLFPIIAHPERVSWLSSDSRLVESLVARGAYVQITAMSLTGELGGGLRKLCEEWIEAGWVHFVASDAHGARLRPPGLAAAYRQVARRFGEEVAARLFVDQPAAVLDDRPLDRV
jgi:protein-tyrosine phosphatase